jgi:uncharacterized repeat protein (TIGR01451 family)
VDLTGLTGTTTLIDVVSSGNTGRGLFVDGAAILNITGLTLLSNTAGGGSISNVTVLNFTGTVGNVRDDITVNGNSLQHTRDPLGANIINQALALANVTNLILVGDDGDDRINVLATPGAILTILADAGNDTISLAGAATTNGGMVFGDTGIDTIDYNAYTAAVAVNLGLGSSGLSGSLGDDQEVPPTTSTATGTVNVTYDVATKTFDITVAVSGIAPALITGFHIHRGGVGTNGPIIVDFTAGPLVPDGVGGFTFSANDVPLDPRHEAALLGGLTYFNAHTAAFPSGIIRGQIFSNGNVNLMGVGTATGTDGITSIENAVGSAGTFMVSGTTFGDSLVGNFDANTLQGGPGPDTLLAGPGGDNVLGEAGNDALVWSNGDGTDVMEGGADTDTVHVNGNVTANDDFTINPGPGGRVDFDRLSPGPFSLDIGTTEVLTVNGIGGDDIFTANSLAGVAALTTVNLNGLAGSDTFSVTPAATVVFNVNGHIPRPPASPGDTLDLNPSGATGTMLTTSSSVLGLAGAYTFTNRAAVNFQQIETLAALADVQVTKLDAPDPVGAGDPLTYTITVTNAGEVAAENVQLSDIIPAGTTFVSAMQTSGPAFMLMTPPVGGGGTFTATIATLAAGASATFTLVVQVDDAAAPGSIITNTATVVTTSMESDPTNNSATTTTTVAGGQLYAVGADAGGGPHVRVFSGTVPTERFSFFAYNINFTGGVRVAMGDITGDGTADIITAAGPGGGPHVRAFDGNTGVQIPGFNFMAYDINFTGGVFVASADFNNDGFADILTGADAGGGPHVKVFSGAGGAVIASFFDAQKGGGGVRVASGDINGDGTPDIITGSGFNIFPVTVRVLSGLSGQPIDGPLGTFFPYPSFAGGVYLAAGDVNGDGRDDVITGAGPGGGPHVKAFSGVTGAEIASFFAYSINFTGGVRVGVGDVNDDGLFDIITGAGPGGGPHVRAFSGAGGAELTSFFAFNINFTGGVFVAGAAAAAVNVISPPEQPAAALLGPEAPSAAEAADASSTVSKDNDPFFAASEWLDEGEDGASDLDLSWVELTDEVRLLDEGI